MIIKYKLYLLFIATLLLLTSCNEESTQAITIETVVKESIHEIIQEKNISKPIKKEIIEKIVEKEYRFTFNTLKNNPSLLYVKNNVYDFQNVKQPIVMINLFSTWCPPCRGQIPHLNSLQKKFKDHLFILSALVHDDIEDKKLNKLIVSEKINFYLSNNQKENLNFAKMISPKLNLKQNFTLPLMILFYNGKYFTHYEGSMPEEMIESDIKLLLEKEKGH